MRAEDTSTDRAAHLTETANVEEVVRKRRLREANGGGEEETGQRQRGHLVKIHLNTCMNVLA